MGLYERKEQRPSVSVCMFVCLCQTELFQPDVILYYSSKRRTVCLSPADTQPRFVSLRDRVMKSFCVFEREDLRVCVCEINCSTKDAYKKR